MNDAAAATPLVADPPPTAGAAAPLAARLLHVAWMSIALGICIELLLVGTVALGGSLKVAPIVADLAQKVSWSIVVCMGLALGTTAGRARADLMGLLGVVSAPLGFAVARAAHKSIGAALGLVGGAAGGVTVVLVAVLKGIEYGILGCVVGVLSSRPRRELRAYLTAGLVIGVIFGTVILVVTTRAAVKPPPMVDLVSRGINELLFPVGCSLVLWAAETMSHRLRA